MIFVPLSQNFVVKVSALLPQIFETEKQTPLLISFLDVRDMFILATPINHHWHHTLRYLPWHPQSPDTSQRWKKYKTFLSPSETNANSAMLERGAGWKRQSSPFLSYKNIFHPHIDVLWYFNIVIIRIFLPFMLFTRHIPKYKTTISWPLLLLSSLLYSRQN